MSTRYITAQPTPRHPPDPSVHTDPEILARCPYCNPKLPPLPPPPPALRMDLRGFPETAWGRKR